MAVTPLFGVPSLTTVRRGTSALHVVVSRSAAVRLAPVAAALAERGAAQVLLDASGARRTEPVVVPNTAIDAIPADMGRIASAVEAALDHTRPATVLIAGDGDAAVVAALAACARDIPVVRVGAGLRCGDRGIESELNRIVLDGLAARLYVDGETAAEQLRAEGFDDERIVAAGNTLADAVKRWRPAHAGLLADLGLTRRGYVLVSLHKPEHVVRQGRLSSIVDAIGALADTVPVILTADREIQRRLQPGRALRGLRSQGVRVSGPLPYRDSLALQAFAGAVVTDSAGMQEETTLLGVPCFTPARSTERTLTLIHGTNVLLGEDPAAIAGIQVGAAPAGPHEIALWDGSAGRRIADDLIEWSGV